jgi:DNA-binding transcriptional MerR regulator
VRIGELSRTSGVPLPTIKFYLREGLLPAGTATGPNQADYGPEHLRRLRLIRVLLDIGKLSVAAARAVVDAVESPELPVHPLLGVAHRATLPPTQPARRDDWAAAREQAGRLVADLGWRVDDCAPALDQVADVIAAATALGTPALVEGFDIYADAAARVAEHDVAVVARQAGDDTRERGSMVEAVVLGTVLGERLFAALRRLAQEDASARRFTPPAPPAPPAPDETKTSPPPAGRKGTRRSTRP